MGFTLHAIKGSNFVGREKIVKDMLTTLRDRDSQIGFALYGRRRLGKTSIYLELQRRLEKESDIIPIYFSMWDLVEGTINEFVKRLSITIIDAYRTKLSIQFKILELLKSSISMIKKILREPKLGLKLKDDIEFLLTFDEVKEKDHNELIEKLFHLPETLAKETNTKCILIIDEFPEIINLKDRTIIGGGIIKKIRTLTERYENTSLCIAGSIRKTLDLVAFSSTSAFYRQFVNKEVKPLFLEDIKEIMNKNLKKAISDKAVACLYDFTKGIPFYVQFLGRILNQLESEKIDEAEIQQAVTELLTEEGNLLFKEEFEKFSPKEKIILINMAIKNVSKYSDIIKSTDVTNLATFLSYLEEKGVLLKQEKGVYKFQDPIFKKWLRLKYEYR